MKIQLSKYHVILIEFIFKRPVRWRYIFIGPVIEAKHCIRESEKNLMEKKRSGSMTTAEASNYTTEIRSLQSTKTFNKYGKKKNKKKKHTHPQDILSQKTGTSLWKKKKKY